MHLTSNTFILSSACRLADIRQADLQTAIALSIMSLDQAMIMKDGYLLDLALSISGSTRGGY